MTEEEAVEILEEICDCTDPMCPDTQYWGLRQRAKSVMEEIYADDIMEQRLEDRYWEEPPVNWEP